MGVTAFLDNLTSLSVGGVSIHRLFDENILIPAEDLTLPIEEDQEDGVDDQGAYECFKHGIPRSRVKEYNPWF